MTESQWLTSTDTTAMIALLRETSPEPQRTRWHGWVSVRRFPITERKWLLFLVACCRRVEHRLPTPEARAVLDIAEQVAEGSADDRALHEAGARASESCPLTRTWATDQWHAIQAVSCVPLGYRGGREHAAEAAAIARAWAGLTAEVWNSAQSVEVVVEAARQAESAHQANLLRDVVGNPFCSAPLDRAWLDWQGGLVRGLAEAVYAGEGVQHPILADALEDAGCADVAVLDHLRGPDPHTRGCWVVDRLTGRG